MYRQRSTNKLPVRTLIVSAMIAPLSLAGCAGQPDGSDTGEVVTEALTSCKATDLTIAKFPLKGTNGKTWMINNYVDLDPTAGTLATKDYKGKTGSLARTYDGHTGMDIDISSFREMDSNSAVIYAVAPGTVDQVIQNNFDRNTSCTGSPNLISIKHANGFKVLYLHIKKNSAKVTVGQTISVGTPLAIAGSAGCSTQPHLHLEVQNCAGKPIETMLQTGMWTSPPVYDPASNIMDVMLLKGAAPTVAQIKDPAPNPKLIAPNSVLGVGLSAALRGGDTVGLIVTDPNGTTSTQSTSIGGVARFGHWYPSFTVNIGGTVGVWTIAATVNGAVKTTRTIGVTTVQPGLAQVGRHGVPAAQYQTEFTDITTAGYRPVWVDGYEVSGATFYNALFGPVNTTWAAHHGMSAATYQTTFNTLVGQGYRLTQVDSYLSGGQATFAAIFDKSPSTAWTAYHAVDQATHQTNFNTLTGQGYRPVNISAVVVGGQRLFTALYDKANVGSYFTLTGMTQDEYQTQFTANVNAGRRLAYVDAFMEAGVPKLSAIWNQQDSGNWVARHGLSSADYQTDFTTFLGQGYLTRCVTGYEDGAGNALFAALWSTK
jgi:hypothetical protein